MLVVNNSYRSLFDKDDTYSLRGVCMLAIIVHHLFQYTRAKYGITYPLPVVLILQDWGYLATAVFFLISGYGTSLSLWKKKQNLIDNARRIGKLYTPFLFYFFIGFAILLTQGILIGNYIGLVSLELPVGGGKWFIISILALYLMLMLYSAVIKDRKLIAISLVVTVLIYIMLQMTVFKEHPIWYNSVLAFPVGVSCAAWRDKIQNFNNSKTGGSILLFFLLSYTLTQFCGRSIFLMTPNDDYLRPLLQVISSTLLALLSIRMVSMVNIQNGWLKYVGINSLSLFLAYY